MKHNILNSIEESAYLEIRNDIISNKLPRGQKINEAQLSERFGINKKHIHDILIQLESLGLVSYYPMKGFVSNGVSKEDIYELAKIRQLFDVAMFGEFIKTASEENMEKMLTLARRKTAFLKEGLDSEASKETGDIYNLLYECLPYERMLGVLKICREYYTIIMNMAFKEPKGIMLSLESNELFYQAMLNKDEALLNQWGKKRYDSSIEKINSTNYFENRD